MSKRKAATLISDGKVFMLNHVHENGKLLEVLSGFTKARKCARMQSVSVFDIIFKFCKFYVKIGK